MVSNRHLPEQLPVGEAGADFHLADNVTIPLRCLAGPTPPHESIVTQERRQRTGSPWGAVAWKLINALSLNHLGLTDRSAQDRAGGLRELLALFGDVSDMVNERRVRGIVSVESRPITRRLRQHNGFNAARGVEIKIRIDERAFEGSGVMLLGAVLDRFPGRLHLDQQLHGNGDRVGAAWPGQALAAAVRHGWLAVSHREALRADPTQFDFFTVMREFERSAGHAADPAVARKPRIGHSSVAAEEVIRLGQDPFLEFPASTVVDYRDGADGVPKLKARFLGFFGPQGALPITTTVEALQWSSQRDESFEDFTNIIANRFLQLFFRAWADARPIVQADRPADDRFFRYVGALSGAGTEAYADRDTMPDIAKVSFAGLTGSGIKSAVRLLQLIESVLKVDVEIVERVGSWLVFEPSDQMALGTARSGLGVDAALGVRAYSINDKIRIRIKTRSLRAVSAAAPVGRSCRPAHRSRLLLSRPPLRVRRGNWRSMRARRRRHGSVWQANWAGRPGWRRRARPRARPAI